MLFLKIFLSAPEIFWRHRESQKRHSGAKAPLLATLRVEDRFKTSSGRRLARYPKQELVYFTLFSFALVRNRTL